MQQSVRRCPWAPRDPLLIAYHDEEWGVPLHDDQKLFEFLVLESAQAGLSWLTVLRKRERYREVFRGFDPAAVARFTPRDVERLLKDPGIIRNRSKIESALGNARRVLEIQQEFGSLDAYLWRFVGNEPLRHRHRRLAEVPAQTAESKALSKDLRARGFTFVGPTTCYAFMQAVGMVNDHLTECFLSGARS